MNRLGTSYSCLICGLDLLTARKAARLITEHESLTRQIANGICDGCQRDRQAAAVEYELAAAEVRLWELLGAKPAVRGRTVPPGSRALHMAMLRVETADARCVALKMWSHENTRPRRFTDRKDRA